MKEATSRKKDGETQHSPARSFFDPMPDIETLAREQGVEPVGDLRDLKCDFWPEDETADDIIKAVREWRNEG